MVNYECDFHAVAQVLAIFGTEGLEAMSDKINKALLPFGDTDLLTLSYFFHRFGRIARLVLVASSIRTLILYVAVQVVLVLVHSLATFGWTLVGSFSFR